MAGEKNAPVAPMGAGAAAVEAPYRKIKTIYARRTQMGAETRVVYVVAVRGDIRIRRHSFSKTGRHWIEEVWATPDTYGSVWVLDRSNSGKDNSYEIVIMDGKVVAEISYEFDKKPTPNADYIPSPGL